MKNKIIFFIFLLMAGASSRSFCQQSISGPSCVLTGITYQYNLKPDWDGVTEMNLCVTGGTIENEPSNCIKTVSLPFIRVVWNKDIIKGSVSFTYGKVRDSIAVFATTPLMPGVLDTVKKIQTISNNSAPQRIICATPTGGNCSPVYSYEWQQSSDGESWENIVGSTGQDISFSAKPVKTTFYRRKITENKSGSVAYSETAVVVIQAADVRAGNQ